MLEKKRRREKEKKGKREEGKRDKIIVKKRNFCLFICHWETKGAFETLFFLMRLIERMVVVF